MKYLLCWAVSTAFFIMNTSQAQLQYPATRKAEQRDTFFGNIVEDPYRWLEDDNSAETKTWVEQQNAVTQNYISTIPMRSKIKAQLEKMWNYPRFSSPFQRGAYYYFYKNDGLQNQSVLYRQKGLDGKPEVFLDPNTLSKDGTVAMSGLTFSKNNKYCAYLISTAGSDWQTAVIMNVETKQQILDRVNWIKFSGLSWKGDEGFYYSRYPKPEEGKASKQMEHHKVYYHKAGRPQQEDVLVYEDTEHPLRNVYAGITEDERYLILNISEGTSGTELWVKDLKKPDAKFAMLLKGFANEASVVDNEDDKIYIFTNLNAPNYRVVLVDPAKPDPKNWKDIIPQKKHRLQNVAAVGGRLLAFYLENASDKVYQHNRSGKLERAIQLPGIGSVGGFDGIKSSTETFYSFTSFTAAATQYRYDIKTGVSTLFRKSALTAFNGDEYETRQEFFTSKDGTKVPMFITCKKGVVLDGNNPVLMYGYGGFNVPITPDFSTSNAFFLQQGGIYVVVNLRGGSEYGEEWHKNGMLFKKQNVFDDFIGAAEYLIAKKYTNNKRLAISGGSNGGLLVGACMVQRPELFRVALPAVGVMDMLRYQLFTIGWAWASEYGNSTNSVEEFKNLYGYSPLHNLKPGTTYPATLVTTADHDDRVVPAHSFKFAARLQETNTGNQPMLIRIETRGGHGAGLPTAKAIEKAADVWSFVMHNLGMTFQE
jgi:prolyl oligopeptidase